MFLIHLVQSVVHKTLYCSKLSEAAVFSNLSEHLITMLSQLMKTLLVPNCKADKRSDQERGMLLTNKLSGD